MKEFVFKEAPRKRRGHGDASIYFIHLANPSFAHSLVSEELVTVSQKYIYVCCRHARRVVLSTKEDKT